MVPKPTPDTPLRVLWRSRLAADLLGTTPLPSTIEVRRETDPERAADHADWAEALVDGRPGERLLDGRALRHVVVPYAGIDPELQRHVLERPRLSLHNSHFNAGFVAQHALALLLSCANRIAEADRAARVGDWSMRNRDGFESLLLAGRRCLLLGYGHIGRALRPMLEGIGMEVAAVRRGPPAPGDPPSYRAGDLLRALSACDAVIVSLPDTPETEGLLGAEALAALRPSAIVVNVGRGSVIDPDALYRSLALGRLFAAGLDVWWSYPRRGEGAGPTLQRPPFHTLDNVVSSPHRANHVGGWEAASLRDVVATLEALAAGGERNRVDPARGY